MKIVFIHEGASNLPEIYAYTKFFSGFGDEVQVLDSLNARGVECDVEWHIMGFNARKKTKAKVLIHEYASLSTPPFSKLKNLVKSLFCTIPDLRVFLNADVKENMRFLKSVPSIYRDMGVDTEIFMNMKLNKEFDFIYVGAMDSTRGIDGMVKYIMKEFPQKKLALLGRAPIELIRAFDKFDEIIFLGSVSYNKVPDYLNKSCVAINWIPNIFPYNIQTSTKALEYIACDLPVLSTRYKWALNFREQLPRGSFFMIDEVEGKGFDDLLMPSLSHHISHDWNYIISRCGIRKEILEILDF